MQHVLASSKLAALVVAATLAIGCSSGESPQGGTAGSAGKSSAGSGGRGGGGAGGVAGAAGAAAGSDAAGAGGAAGSATAGGTAGSAGAGGARDAGVDVAAPVAACDPASFRPLAKDGFTDAVAMNLPATDSARNADANVATGELKSNLTVDGHALALYVPAAYAAAKAGDVAIMFFLSPSGTWYRNTTVLRLFDNLIASHEMPVTLAAFVTVANKQEMESSPKAWVDEWADKFFPALKQMFPKLSDSPAMHAAAGGSSWGLGSFHLGWYRPDFLGKVLTHSGSFVCFGVLKDYPAAIRAADKKPLRIAMTVGDCDIVGMTCSDACNTRSLCSVDASNCHADWQTTNRNVAMAFADKGYPYRLVRGSGGHQEAFWTSLLGDDLRWLWRPAVCGM